MGLFPIAPGTLCSLVTTIVVFLYKLNMNPSIGLQIFSLILLTILGTFAARATQEYFKKQDPGECVIDEVAGQMLPLIIIEASFSLKSIGCYLLAFIIFRAFDILKPFPISFIDRRLKNGLGIMLDDILAGIFTLGLIYLII